MRIDILTLFPMFFDSPLKVSIINRAVEHRKVELNVVNIRQYAKGRHKTCDDRPFGGGPGMVMIAEPVYKALKAVRKNKDTAVVLLTPQGEVYTQHHARMFTQKNQVVLICGHYEGIDDRIRKYVTHEISVGDYILSGGESAALAVADSIIRLIPGVVSNKESVVHESFTDTTLDWPQYTRPRKWRGVSVPKVLLSGNHKHIETWRKKVSLELTHDRRPELLKKKSYKNIK
ncbi:MAG: tRNA (guanosine(37)-N1)-methyltransferase TrmD [Elusimicrobiota bacterium]